MTISIWKLLIVVLIITLLFGTKKLRTLGSDLGEAIKGFKKAMSDDVPSSHQHADADFETKAITEKSANTQQSIPPEQKNNQKKEQE